MEKILWVESLGIHYFNGADGFNLPLILLTGIVHFTGVLTMWELRGIGSRSSSPLSSCWCTGVFGFFMSMDLFFLFVWYDVSLFPMYPLIAIWGTTRKEYGAMKLFLYLLAGSALVLPAIIYLLVASGLNTFDLLALMQPGASLLFSRPSPSSSSTWDSAFSQASGPSIPGRPSVTWRPPPRSACSMQACS